MGSDLDNLLASETPPELRPRDVVWRDEAPLGKLDLLVTLDFRMTSTGLFADVVLPAATWYEKSDLSCTDLHPYVHSFNAAIDPPWEARSDWDAFSDLARVFSQLAAERLGVRRDLVATALAHDTPAEASQPFGEVKDWRAGEVEPLPGKTMPALSVVERDFGAIHDKLTSLGPLVESRGVGAKGVVWRPEEEVAWLGAANGLVAGGAGDGRPSLERAEQAAEAILALSGATNGRLAHEGFTTLEKRVGRPLADLVAGERHVRIRWSDVKARPQKTLTSPEWSGNEAGERQYSAFTINVERRKPWHTLTGRMHCFLDHQWLAELGEQLPVWRPPLNTPERYPEAAELGDDAITLRYLTPHSKWSIHTDYQENPLMLTLFRGGTVVSALARGRGRDRGGRQRLGRGLQSQRAAGLPRRRLAAHAEGVCYIYHAKDRHVAMPRTEKTGKRGGTHNALTRVLLKPTHMVGGYAQLSYAVNYYGCYRQPARRGRRRAAPRRAEGELLMRVRAQLMMVMALDKCLGCHTCSVTCKQAWTNRDGAEYMWFNNVETKPGTRLPAALGGPATLARWLAARRQGPSGPARRRAPEETGDDLRQPRPAVDRRLLRALDLRLCEPDHCALGSDPAGHHAALQPHGQAPEPGVGSQLGGQPGRHAHAR